MLSLFVDMVKYRKMLQESREKISYVETGLRPVSTKKHGTH
jgi:hypothetical protein